jgi:PAS domain S-box-containing protein
VGVAGAGLDGLSDDLLRQMVGGSPLGLAVADADGLLLHANQAYCDLVGRPLHELVGRSSREWTAPEQLAQHAGMATLEELAERRGERPVVETRYVRPSGERRWAWVTTARLRGPAGERWTAGYVQDITARRHAEDALRGAALTDPLTGLLNRRGWRERTDVPAAGPLVVVMLDLDHFKAFNDRFGHGAGDELLRAFGVALAASVAPGSVVARWGGEEFALALPPLAAAELAGVLDGLGALLPPGQTLSGGHTVQRPGESVADTLDRADRLLYEAKAAGRARFVTDAGGVRNGTDR